MSAALALFFLAATPASGEPQGDCAHAIAQPDMNDCELARLVVADKKLNNQWQITLQAYQKKMPADVIKLRQAQRAWIAFRDAECDAEHPWDIGVSLDKMLNIECRTDLTEERTRKLIELIELVKDY